MTVKSSNCMLRLTFKCFCDVLVHNKVHTALHFTQTTIIFGLFFADTTVNKQEKLRENW